MLTDEIRDFSGEINSGLKGVLETLQHRYLVYSHELHSAVPQFSDYISELIQTLFNMSGIAQDLVKATSVPFFPKLECSSHMATWSDSSA